MKRLIDLVKLDRLDSLIRRKATGNPTDLAKRLKMSVSSMYDLLRFLKTEMKAPIKYDTDRPSYVYEYTPKFYLGFERDVGTDDMNTFGRDLDANSKKKIKVEIKIDDDKFILDEDIDFNDLYH